MCYTRSNYHAGATQQRIKTDKRDAEIIAKCLAQHNYSPVHIPTATDEQTKEFLRMRDDHKLALKKSSSKSLRSVFATTIAMMVIVIGHQHIYVG